jgi:transcriptional regulator with XRE-family HTH domain
VSNGSEAASGAAYRHAVGRTVHVLRTGRAWSLRVLSDRSGLSVAFLSEIERGRKEPSGTVLGQLAEAFDLSLSDLLVSIARTLDAGSTDFIDGAGQVPHELRAALARLGEHERAELARFVAYLEWRSSQGPERGE